MNEDFDILMEWDTFDPVETLAWLDAYSIVITEEEEDEPYL